MSNLPVGLVLSGGGAKGAYQVGVLKAILHSGGQVDAIAGASIGALNGGVLASAPSLEIGVKRLEQLWMTLANEPPIAPNFPAYFEFLLAVGLRIRGLWLLPLLKKILGSLGGTIPAEKTFLSSRPLYRLMEEYFDPEALTNGLPLYISVYRSNGAIIDILSFLASESGLKDSPDSEFIHIQSMPRDQQRDALLASAALPLLFEGRFIDGVLYRDGGIGGSQSAQGNTPITPLLQAGIQRVFVTHLSDGALWRRQDFPEATILEIRPQSAIRRDGGVKDLMGFNPSKIPAWIEQGYEDTQHCLKRVSEATAARATLHSSQAMLNEDQAQFEHLDQALTDVLRRLR